MSPPQDLSLARAEAIWLEQLWRVFVVLIIVFVPVAIVGSVITANRLPVPEFYLRANDPARIYYVIPGSGAEAAGVRAGDTILRMNGLVFNANDLPRIIQNLRVGEPATFTLEQPGGGQFDAVVPLVPLAKATGDYTTRNSLVALALWSVSAFLLMRRFHRGEVRLLFLLAQAIALGVLIPSLSFIIWLHSARTWPNVSGVNAFLSTALLLHFHTTFPVVLGSRQQRRWGLGLVYALTGATATAWVMVNYGWLPYAVGVVCLIYVAMVIMGAMLALVYVYMRRATPDGRRRLRVILVGNLVAGVPLTTLYLWPLVTLGYPLIPGLVLALCLAAAPVAYVYAVVRHNLFGIDRLLSRTLVYAVIFVAIFVVYAVPLLILDRLIPFGWMPRAVVVAALTLVTSAAFDWTRRRVQRRVDQIFYGSWYDYPKVVELTSAALARAVEWQDLVEVLTRQVPRLMQLRGAQLQMGDQATPPLDSMFRPQLRFPLGNENAPAAVWIVSHRHDDDDVSTTDRRILKTIARQAGIAVSNVRLVQTLRLQLDEIRASRESLTRLQHELLRMREEERRRLARDLHDGPIQSLASLNVQLSLLAGRPEVGEPPTPVASALGDMRAEVRTLLADLRQVCADLRPPILDTLGLGAALRALAQTWSAQHETPVKLDLAPDTVLQTLPGEVTVNLYRVVQESLNNIASHASALHVALSLQWGGPEDGLHLAIEDDGQGFTPANLPQPSEGGHFGLAAMQERVALIGGQWCLNSAPGQGTKISVCWRQTAKTSAELPPITA